MAILTASSTFAIGDATTSDGSAIVEILPPLGSASGKGRIIHPTLGTYDYASAPDAWVGFGTEMDIAPLWQSDLTLSGAVSTVWSGTLKDELRQEIWANEPGLFALLAMVETLQLFYFNPPDPSAGQYILWYPNYISPVGFKALMVGLTVGNERISRDFVVRGGDGIAGPVTVTWRVEDFA